MSLDSKITQLTEDVATMIGNILPASWYMRDEVPVAVSSGTSIQIYPTSVKINGELYKNPSSVTLALNTAANWDNGGYATASSRAGKDVYIYACTPAKGTEPVFKLSVNSTVPSGYSASTSRKIGGFHCLCLAVGAIAGHTLNNWATGSILPLSVWDLKHRAVCGSEGMVYVNGLWTDIYLAGWNGSKLVSQFGAQIADGDYGTNPADGKGFSGESFAEYASYVGKRLISRDHFMAIAEGSNQRTNIKNSSDPGTTGGHYDTGGRRMISNCGCEDCCGVLWQWCSEAQNREAQICGNFPVSSGDIFDMTKTSYNIWTKWLDPAGINSEICVWETYHDTIDPTKTSLTVTSDYATKGKGLVCRGSAFVRLMLGGDWYNGAICGSRAVYCDNFSSHRHAYNGARCAAEPYVG